MINKIINNIKFIIRRINFKSSFKEIKDKKDIDKITIFSDNCIAGAIYKELGVEFKSPTIGLFFCGGDFVKFCSDLDHYLSVDIIEATESKWLGACSYPIGILDDIEVHFLHYRDINEAKKAWNRRRERIIKDNMYFIMTDRDYTNYTDMVLFNSLRYENKIIFSAKKHKNLNSLVYCDKYKEKQTVGVIASYLEFMDYIDIISWFFKSSSKVK